MEIPESKKLTVRIKTGFEPFFENIGSLVGGDKQNKANLAINRAVEIAVKDYPALLEERNNLKDLLALVEQEKRELGKLLGNLLAHEERGRVLKNDAKEYLSGSRWGPEPLSGG